MSDYVLTGVKWTQNIVSWYWNGGSGDWANEISQAFNAWSSNIGLRFVQANSSAAADIVLDFAALDGPYNTLGITSYSYQSSTHDLTRATINFDSGESWNWSAAFNGYALANGATFYEVALHEIGHAIGLGHPTNPDVAMSPILNTSVVGLTGWDIYAAQLLYGPSSSSSQANWLAPTVKAFVDSTMVTFFDASATAPLETWAAGFLGASSPATQVSSAQVLKLGAAFGGTTLFHSLYGALTDVQFLNTVSTNLTGASLDASLTQYFGNLISSTESQTNPATARQYTVDEARGAVAALLAEGFVGAQPSAVTGTPYQTQWKVAVNRTDVSAYFAGKSAIDDILLPQSVSASDKAWVFSQSILDGVTQDQSTVSAAHSAIDAAVTTHNLNVVGMASVPLNAWI